MPRKELWKYIAAVSQGWERIALTPSNVTHSADTYQFGYFLRNTEPHAIVIKVCWFSLFVIIAK